ncbi:hypothetical protein [Helicobacter vulpis]|uniref:hypothetical protein n=1 Tax=Helicobacter vulpis TaxID=2316076 RepID=UPI0013CE2236|nr:hypothetical protein [Helicobacter vulpis]
MKNKHEKNSAPARDSFCKKDQSSMSAKKRPILVRSLENLKEMLNFSQFKLNGLEEAEQEAFQRFIAHREGRTKVTWAMKRALLKRFLELKAEGADLCACVDLSVRRGYNDVYVPTPKQERGRASKTQKTPLFEHLIASYEGLNYQNIEKAILKAFEFVANASPQKGYA